MSRNHKIKVHGDDIIFDGERIGVILQKTNTTRREQFVATIVSAATPQLMYTNESELYEEKPMKYPPVKKPKKPWYMKSLFGIARDAIKGSN